MGAALERIMKMLELSHTDETVFPSTDLYNEGWMLRLVLSLASEGIDGLPFKFLPGARWFSETLIDSPFHSRFRGDPRAEGQTHLDSAIGHFDFRPGTKAALNIISDATQFVVIEAKMFSALSSRTTNAWGYDQAARTVACMAWAISRSKRAVKDFDSLGFYVVAPIKQIDSGVFSSKIEKDSIREKVSRRVDSYTETDALTRLMKWHKDFFLPTLERADISCVTWESVIEKIGDPAVQSFYDRCLKFNDPHLA